MRLCTVIVELGMSARNYCELSGRTQPVIGDVIVSLINSGLSVHGLEAYAKRDKRQVVPNPQQISTQKQLNLLQAGTKNSHPSHIPNYLPVLPDPHAYIRTPVGCRLAAESDEHNFMNFSAFSCTSRRTNNP